tara:strand:+ start:27336 stop:28043 length:708 start_codon:yes stop_codon:yes gene_type:complete
MADSKEVLNPQLQKLLKFLQDGQTYSRTTSTKAFTVVRFHLDEKRTRASREGNLFDQSFMGVWVIGSNKKKFSATLFVNDNNNASDGIPLRSNMTIPFEIPMAGATLSWEAQENTYIDVLFSHHSAINVGSIEQELKGVIVNSDGSSYDHDQNPVTKTPTQIFDVDSNRGVGTIFNYSSEILYLGKESILNDVNYQKKSLRCYPDQSFEWRNSDELYVRTALTDADDVVVLNEGV